MPHPFRNEIFDNLNEKTSDNEIIDIILDKLNNSQKQEYLFDLHYDFLNDERIERIIKLIEHHNLANVFGTSYSTNIPLIITKFGTFISSQGGWLSHLQTIKDKEQKEKQDKDYKSKLEVTKLELETEKLTYETKIRDLKYENDLLTNTNQKFQKYKNIKDFFLWFGVPLGWVFSHYGFFEYLLKLL